MITDILIGGLLLGGIYALIALGLTLIFGVSQILNVAHGDLLMLGALASYLIFSTVAINPFITLPLLMAVLLGIGIIFERGLIRPVYKKPAELLLVVSIIVTLGASMLITDVTAWWTGMNLGKSYFGVDYSIPPIEIGDTRISSIRLISLLSIFNAAIILHIFVRRSYTGKAIRAITQDREAAMAVGINISKISMITFGIGTMLAGLAGFFMVMITTVTAYSGMPLTFKALTILILGGMGSFAGSILGAIIIGLIEANVAFFAGATWSPMMAILILIIILIIRPQGLFGKGRR